MFDANTVLAGQAADAANRATDANLETQRQLQLVRAAMEESQNASQWDSTIIDVKIKDAFKMISRLSENIVALSGGLTENAEKIEAVGYKTDALENVLRSVLERLDKIQLIEDQVINFIGNIKNVLLEISKEVARIDGNPFDAEKFEAELAISRSNQVERLLPSEVMDKAGFSRAYAEAILSLLVEFKLREEEFRNIDFNQNPPVQIAGKEVYSDEVFKDAEIFGKKCAGKISYKQFEEFLSGKEGEMYVNMQLLCISSERKNTIWDNFFLAVDRCVFLFHESANSPQRSGEQG